VECVETVFAAVFVCVDLVMDLGAVMPWLKSTVPVQMIFSSGGYLPSDLFRPELMLERASIEVLEARIAVLMNASSPIRRSIGPARRMWLVDGILRVP